MTWTSPVGAATLAAAGALAAALVVLAYVLKMRRRRCQVPFSPLWDRVLRESSATTIWRRLKRWLSLLLQLVLLALLLAAAGGPELGANPQSGRHIAIIVDASASMTARDAGDDNEPRIAHARRLVLNLIDSLGDNDAAMIIRMDGNSTPITRFERRKPALIAAVEALAPSDTEADLRRALRAAADALRGRPNPTAILIGDGAYRETDLTSAVWDSTSPRANGAERNLSAIDLTGVDLRFMPVGSTGENIGIIAFNVRRYVANRAAYEALIEVQSFRGEPARAKLTIYHGPVPIDVQILELDPGQKQRRILANLGGGTGRRLRAVLEPLANADGTATFRDPFGLDNEAFALLPERKQQIALLVSENNLYLEAALLAYDNVEIFKVRPQDYDREVKAGTLPEYDAVIFDDYTPAALPPRGDLLYFRPRGEHSPFPITGTIARPRITETARSHPVMRWVALNDVNFDELSTMAIDRSRGDVALARSVRATVMAAGRRQSRNIVAFGFSLRQTDAMLRVAFPLLLVNTLDWFAGDDADLLTTHPTGQPVRVDLEATDVDAADVVEAHGPDGRRRTLPVAAGAVTLHPDKVGIYDLVARRKDEPIAQLAVAANLANPFESAIAPQPGLRLGARDIPAPAPMQASNRRALWSVLALIALALLAVEWWTYNRRVTV